MNQKITPAARRARPEPTFDSVVWTFVSADDADERRAADREIARMIELNGLVAFDPEMIDLD